MPLLQSLLKHLVFIEHKVLLLVLVQVRLATGMFVVNSSEHDEQFSEPKDSEYFPTAQYWHIVDLTPVENEPGLHREHEDIASLFVNVPGPQLLHWEDPRALEYLPEIHNSQGELTAIFSWLNAPNPYAVEKRPDWHPKQMLDPAAENDPGLQIPRHA